MCKIKYSTAKTIMKIYRCEGRMQKKKTNKEVKKPLVHCKEFEPKVCVVANKDDSTKVPPPPKSAFQEALDVAMKSQYSPLDQDFWSRALTNHFQL